MLKRVFFMSVCLSSLLCTSVMADQKDDEIQPPFHPPTKRAPTLWQTERTPFDHGGRIYFVNRGVIQTNAN